ncbi:signal recognition particle subunit FFH/SRP54 (srp54) [Nonlabens sp. Hel1_33_55]|uniref:AAA family ATPase n=1 Tax=Nonlabens sp. Hel1_33_55 TaxID=1336802 RepID=UPI000875DB05|nr:AAA family ATPase [Nonlabens sp. Hel1_33_55]SCY36481.1 signal recognition particle subunit FFH/SRP54 (srp54) [Nonlabens sp. Hel1_33_55]
MKLIKAERHQVKLRLGLSGASGFGKTMSALLLAYGITENWSKICVIDTENNSASLYSHLGDYNVLTLNEPYSPERYIEAISICEEQGMEVVIIDSITHEWQGNGGCLSIHEKLGGRFQDWAKVSPRHQSFIDKILNSTAHIITTVRRKIDYSLDTNGNGRTTVIKHGTKEITREGFEYELTVNFELINDKHLVSVSKDRTGLFMNKPEFIINSATGRKLKSWCNTGKSLDEIKEEILTARTEADLKIMYDSYKNHHSVILPLLSARKIEIIQSVEIASKNSNVINPNQIVK